ncbi:hypothetical protein FOCC_FOCC002773 [Frankliniella occidentalis]|nr:hypothetical protein FOCC_FOCC002773 [Frankliniella occidentalis]
MTALTQCALSVVLDLLLPPTYCSNVLKQITHYMLKELQKMTVSVSSRSSRLRRYHLDRTDDVVVLGVDAPPAVAGESLDVAADAVDFGYQLLGVDAHLDQIGRKEMQNLGTRKKNALIAEWENRIQQHIEH